MEASLSRRKELITYLLAKNILVDQELLALTNELDFNSIKEFLESYDGSESQLMYELRKLKQRFIPHPRPESNLISSPVQESEIPVAHLPRAAGNNVKILFSYTKKPKQIELQDFVAYYVNRFTALKKILQARPELQSPLSINRLAGKRDREPVAIIGMVKDKETTKSGGISLILEDLTGSVKVFVNKNNKELFGNAQDIVLDQVVGIVGAPGNNIVFANSIIEPDISFREQKKAPIESYALFLSDLHVGSRLFLRETFERFLAWINGGSGKQHEWVSKIKYIFVAGDIVDGCSIYPGQEKELEIPDIYSQYKECAALLSRIPKHITIIISPGNHDAMRISEPQPELYKDFAADLWKLENVVMVSNPGMVNIESAPGFPGFDVLIYHGYSFDYYIANVESIRNNGGYDRPDLIMRFMLKKRHLAPTHTSTLYIPDPESDPLVIDKVPDIFVTGHLHKVSARAYKHVTLICGSCWQDKTPFQEKLGHNPEPGRVPVLNLQTRELRILRF
ncbi:DNA-directed DNA polymerase II small subunit [Candidatus Woesearchaeota archaeon]|nr:DNA-directed DNA polymerase II small subunit [Candidatus Woesearchaeota archaeon]